MFFSKRPARVPNGETIFSSLALTLKSQESRDDCVRKDLMHRLKEVCANLSSAVFEAFVLKTRGIHRRVANMAVQRTFAG